MNFDLIIGNPPYNMSDHKGNKLYVLFMMLGIDLLKDDGKLLYVTPSGWTKSLSKKMKKIQSQFKRKLVYINYDIQHHFDIGEEVCYFVYDNTKDNSDNIIEFPYIPNKMVKNIFDKVNKLHDIKVKDITKILTIKYKEELKNNNISINRNDEFNIPIFYRFYPDKKKEQKEIYFGKKAYNKNIKYGLAINNSGKYLVCKLNNYVISGQGIGLYFDTQTELDNAYILFTSKLYKFLIKHLKTGGFNYDVVMNLKMLNVSKEWSDKELYKYFKLSENEINFIKENV